VLSFETEKAKLRQILNLRRKEIPSNQDWGQSFKDIFLKQFTLCNGHTCAGYWPMSGELDVVPLLSHMAEEGVICGLPVVEAAASPLKFRRWRVGDSLCLGPYGTRHPQTNQELIEPKMLLVPLLGFDRTGGRLGFGGGYYDRTIASLRKDDEVCCIGVGFDEQQVDCIPMGPYDQRLDWIVTPSRTIQCK
jgi:5-formyltetrahydrofolate cyclo-ligase